MIVLDSSVLSELMRSSPDGRVADWVLRVPGPELWTTAISVAEVDYGCARLPAGRRRDDLRAVADALFARFSDRIAAFDADAAVRYGSVVASREERSRPISMADAQIAAVCQARDAVLATRNVADFEGTGIEIVNPWSA